jgi:hypothetical protein
MVFMASSIPVSDKVKYEAPRADVCGAFFVECAGAAVSVLAWGITQEGWGTDVPLGESDANGDLWLAF